MWSYEKKLQYPVKIANPNPKLAQIVMTQYGGPESIGYRRHIQVSEYDRRIKVHNPTYPIKKQTTP